MNRSTQAILIKETRENLRLTGLIFLVTAGLLALGFSDQFRMGAGLLGRTFLLLCTLIYPVAGLAMGLVQVFQDAGKGRWQFVSHRPISRTRWFCCKVVVGISLYLIATLPPLLALIIWAATPGHVPGPFSWDMIEPALTHLLSGVIWYAGGLLLAIRQARWFGSRIIPLGGSLVAEVLYQGFAATLPLAIAVIVISSGLTLAAAWGVFIANGEAPRSSRWVKPLIGFSTLAGWIVVFGVSMSIGEAVLSVVQPQQLAPSSPNRMIEIDAQGELHIAVYDRNTVKQIEDLAGHVVGKPTDVEWTQRNLTQTSLFIPELSQGKNPWLARSFENSFLHADSHAIRLNVGASGNWYYVPSRRTIEGFDQDNRQAIGSLGKDGFAGPDQVATPFSTHDQSGHLYDFYTTTLLNFPEAVYDVNIPDRHVRRVYSASDADPVVASGSWRNTDLNTRQVALDPDYFAVATQKSFHILKGDEPIMTAPIEYNFLRNIASVGRTVTGNFVIAYGINTTAYMDPATISIYSPTGTLIHRTDLPAKRSSVIDINEPVDFEEIAALTVAPPAICATVLQCSITSTALSRRLGL